MKHTEELMFRKPVGVEDSHFQVKYKFPHKQTPDPHKEKRRRQFYRELRKILPGNLTQYTSTKSSVDVSTLEKAEEIFELASNMVPTW